MGQLGRHPPIGLLFPLDRALSSRAMGELGRHPPIGVSSDRDRREESCEELETDRVSGAKRPPDGAGQNAGRTLSKFFKVFLSSYARPNPT